MAKTLKCEYSGKLWNVYDIVELPIDEIWGTAPIIEDMANKPFRKNLIEDIKKDGMHFPIMVVETNGRQCYDAKQKYQDRITPLPFVRGGTPGVNNDIIIYKSCWGGSQRLNIAKELGYTHIDAAILPSIQEAIDCQKYMREPFMQRYYLAEKK